MSHHHHDVSVDRTPAVAGLLIGGLAIFAILFGVVKWTNAQFDAHEGKGGAAAHAEK